MIYVMAIQKIKDYDKWKKIFDDHGAVRKANCSKGALIYHDLNDPNRLVVITEWENMEDAKNFSSSEDLKITMKNAGVIGLPELHYLDGIEKSEY